MSATLTTRLGRHGHLEPVEERQFDIATRFLPGGALGGNALPDDAKFVFSSAGAAGSGTRAATSTSTTASAPGRCFSGMRIRRSCAR